MKFSISTAILAVVALASAASAASAVAIPAPSSALVPKAYEGLKYLGRTSVRGADAGLGGVGVHEATSDLYISTKKARWIDAREDCVRLTGGEAFLVVIESAEKDEQVHEKVTSSDVDKIREYLWTSGAYDSDKRVWHWDSTGEDFGEFTNWNGGQEPIFVEPLARVAFRSADIRNHKWHMKQDGEEENYYICEVPTYRNDTPVPCRRDTDLLIVLDGSGSIGVAEFDLGKEFSALLAGAFGARYAKSRTGFIVYSTTSELVFGLSSGLDSAQIDTAIRSARYPGGSTATDLAIDDAVTQLKLSATGIPRKMVVLTDGHSNNPQATAEAAARATAANITSFSVGIGSGVNQDELLIIAGGDPANRFTVADFDELLQVIAPICVRVCQA